MVTVISSLAIQQECTHDLFLTMSWGGGEGVGPTAGLREKISFFF